VTPEEILDRLPADVMIPSCVVREWIAALRAQHDREMDALWHAFTLVASEPTAGARLN
jgi:hypothetical protein